MSFQLPCHNRVVLPKEPLECVNRAVEIIKGANTQASPFNGYIQIGADPILALLFLLKGKAFAAGTLYDGRPSPLVVPRFFSLLTQGEVQLCQTDLPLFLCTAVMFRKAPAAQIPANLVDSATLLQHIEQMSKDAVIVIRRGQSRNLCFCLEGKPQALYPAPGQIFPEGSDITERIVSYTYEKPGTDVILDLYNEVRLAPTIHAGKPLVDYLNDAAVAPEGPQPVLEVRLGERVVFHFPMTLGEVRVGRGGDNELLLDNLSVSRQHAFLSKHGKILRCADLGSENGITVAGEKTKQVDLNPGDAVGIGKYTLIYREFNEQDAASLPAVPRREVDAVDETISIAGQAILGEIEYKSKHYPMPGFMFTMGSKTEANIRIAGLFVAPVHARIYRRGDGRFCLEHVAGGRSVRVNGQKIKKVDLSDGDQMVIAGCTMNFSTRKVGA